MKMNYTKTRKKYIILIIRNISRVYIMFSVVYSLNYINVDRYQNELPKQIKSRGKDAHCSHEELVQLMKWKQAVSI